MTDPMTVCPSCGAPVRSRFDHVDGCPPFGQEKVSAKPRPKPFGFWGSIFWVAVFGVLVIPFVAIGLLLAFPIEGMKDGFRYGRGLMVRLDARLAEQRRKREAGP